MSSEFLSPGRVPVLRRLLLVIVGFAALLLVLGLVFVVGGDESGGVLVLVIGAVFGLLAGLSLRAVHERSPSARRVIVVTGAVVIVSSVLLVGILVGLLTVITGVGLLMVTFAPERDPQ